VVGLPITALKRFIAESASEKKSLKIGDYLAKLKAKRWLPRVLRAPGHHTAERY